MNINQNLVNFKELLDHGHIELLEIMGDDHTPANDARVSYSSNETRRASDDEQLTRYLLRHMHMSPFEMIVLKWRIKMPIFVARQHIRHRMSSINERSLRYSEAKDEFFIPSHLKKQSAQNHQGSQEVPFLSAVANEEYLNEIKKQTDDTYEMYQELIDADISREIARTILPVSGYTEMIWKIDLRNLFNYMKLRLDHHAQYEIRVYAQAMYDILKQYLPMCMKAFDDYILNAKTFTVAELDIIQHLLTEVNKSNYGGVLKDIMLDSFQSNTDSGVGWSHSLTKREFQEFMLKFEPLIGEPLVSGA
jgi:thymidylate synthase (FAD)